MKKKLNNVKGFTLVELLAVIVIMGILMMVAIPNISRITNNSKKKVFANNAEAYIRQARTAIDSEDIEAPEIGKPVFIPTEYLDMQSSNSPFTGKPMKGTIKVENISTNNEKKYKYYFSGLDDAKNGIDDWISEDQLIKSENYNFVKMNTESKAEGIDETKTEPYFYTENKTINFTINGTAYSATKGMTWGDWITNNGGSSTGNGILWVSPTAGFTDQEIAKKPEFNGGVWSNYRQDTRANGLYLSLYMEIPSHYSSLPTERFCKWDGNSHIPMLYSTIIEDNVTYGGDEWLLNNYCCFDAGTKILMANKKEKNIEDIKIGDIVMSYNEKSKKFEPNKVTNTLVKHNSDDLVYVKLSDGTKLGMRSYHPLLTEEGYKSLRPEFAESIMDTGKIVDKLKVGDTIIGINGNSKITSIERRTPKQNTDTYNFTVENNHNYIANGHVVHNAGCPT